jgi:hypothetical protein
MDDEVLVHDNSDNNWYGNVATARVGARGQAVFAADLSVAIRH